MFNVCKELTYTDKACVAGTSVCERLIDGGGPGRRTDVYGSFDTGGMCYTDGIHCTGVFGNSKMLMRSPLPPLQCQRAPRQCPLSLSRSLWHPTVYKLQLNCVHTFAANACFVLVLTDHSLALALAHMRSHVSYCFLTFPLLSLSLSPPPDVVLERLEDGHEWRILSRQLSRTVHIIQRAAVPIRRQIGIEGLPHLRPRCCHPCCVCCLRVFL